MHDVYRRPFEVDAKEYPFEDHWFPYRGGNVHYVDEGDGPTVVLLHGNPTWSFLYRKVIRELRDECRLVAPDYLGFGMSSPPFVTFRYTAPEHAETVAALIQRLGLKDIVLVVQDWGGPIGLKYAADHPDNVRGLVIMNTFLWEPPFMMRLFSGIMGGAVFGKFLQTRMNFFAKNVIQLATETRLSETVMHAYTAPFPTASSRIPTWVFPRELVASGPWCAEISRRLGPLQSVPVKLVMGVKDSAIANDGAIARWKRLFPHADLERLEDANHYLQEDRPDRVAAAIRDVLVAAGLAEPQEEPAA